MIFLMTSPTILCLLIVRGVLRDRALAIHFPCSHLAGNMSYRNGVSPTGGRGRPADRGDADAPRRLQVIPQARRALSPAVEDAVRVADPVICLLLSWILIPPAFYAGRGCPGRCCWSCRRSSRCRCG